MTTRLAPVSTPLLSAFTLTLAVSTTRFMATSTLINETTHRNGFAIPACPLIRASDPSPVQEQPLQSLPKKMKIEQRRKLPSCRTPAENDRVRFPRCAQRSKMRSGEHKEIETSLSLFSQLGLPIFRSPGTEAAEQLVKDTGLKAGCDQFNPGQMT